MVTVEFEGMDKTFQVYKGLICHYSEYFRAAFNGRFTESNGVSKLPNSEYFGFATFFNWMMEGKLSMNVDELAQNRLKVVEGVFEVYIFADAHIIPALKNAVIDVCIESFAKSWSMPSAKAVNQVWRNCPEGDGMHELLVDFVTKSNNVIKWNNMSLKSEAFFPERTRDQYPAGFLFKVCKTLVDQEHLREAKTSGGYWHKIDKCKYHDHTEIAHHTVVAEVEEAEGTGDAQGRKKAARKRKASTATASSAPKRARCEAPSLFG
jgi:hypothetical protein